jgi:hypothetical protein
LVLLCLPSLLLLLLLRGTINDSTIGFMNGSAHVARVRICSYAMVYLLSLGFRP